MKLALSIRAQCACFGCCLLLAVAARGQSHRDANYDESKVPEYVLPDVLELSDGTKVRDAETWRVKRRPEILRLFQEQVYGKAPGRPADMRFKVRSVKKDARGGKATRKEITIYFTGSNRGPKMDLLLYVPNSAKKPVPAFLGLNFAGNHSVDRRAGRQALQELDARTRGQGRRRQTSPGHRGVAGLPGRPLVDRRHSRSRLRPGHGLLRRHRPRLRRRLPERRPPALLQSGSNAAGRGRVGLDRRLGLGIESRAGLLGNGPGHRRAAAWPSSAIPGWARRRSGPAPPTSGSRLVISNDSGCGGAALSRRRFGETVDRINTQFPHWFCDNFNKYNDAEDTLPVDQHMLIALIAPRPVYVASAEDDRWADPRGEFLAAKAADPVYRLLGTSGLAAEEMPAVDHPANSGHIAYHVRSGGHDLTALRLAAVFGLCRSAVEAEARQRLMRFAVARSGAWVFLGRGRQNPDRRISCTVEDPAKSMD